MTENIILRRYEAQDLLTSGFDLPVPCLVEGISPKPLRCEKILRMLPGKRLVFLADDSREKLIIKLMGHGSYAVKQHNREIEGSQSLTAAGLTTPTIVDHGIDFTRKISFVSYRYLAQGLNLSEVFKQSDNSKKIVLLETVFQIIARMHNHGIFQQDIHLENFMLQNEKIYTLDCASIVKPTSKKIISSVAITNLGLFVAQLYPHLDPIIEKCFDQYQREINNLNFSFQQVKLAALRARTNRMRRYRKKVFKSTSAHCCTRSWQRYLICRRENYDSDMNNFFRNPDAAISQGKTLKAGNSATVSLVSIGTQKYVVKRYNIKGIWHSIKRLFQTTRAWRSWRSAHMLALLDIETPQPVALLEYRFGPLRRKAYLVTEYLATETGSFLNELINKGLTEEQGEKLFAPLFNKMQHAKVSHGDFKASNFFIKDNSILVIDLDAMRLHKTKRSAEAAISKDKDRFHQNWK